MKKTVSVKRRLAAFIILIILVFSTISLSLISVITLSNYQYNKLFVAIFDYTNLSHEISKAYVEFENYVQTSDKETQKSYEESMKNAFGYINSIKNSVQNEDAYYAAVGLEQLLLTFDESNIEVFESLSSTAFGEIYPMLTHSQSLYNYINLRLSSASKDQSVSFKSQFDLISKTTSVSVLIVIITLIAFFIIVLLYMLKTSKSISVPLITLTEYSKIISHGQFETKDITPNGFVEIEVLADSLNTMKHKINNMIEDVKDKAEIKARLQESELKMLQSQINPHFLFNTLNSISRLAYTSNSFEIIKLIDALSEMLRYSLNKIDRPITLLEEINNLNNYIYIQQIRFKDKLNVHFNITSHNLNIPVPCLILQPLVENSIIHGLKPYDYCGNIYLNIYDEKNTTVAEIKDDGAGMTKEALNKLMQVHKNNDNVGYSSIGYSNVALRLANFLGSFDCIKIVSEENEGTTVTIVFKREER